MSDAKAVILELSKELGCDNNPRAVLVAAMDLAKRAALYSKPHDGPAVVMVGAASDELVEQLRQMGMSRIQLETGEMGETFTRSEPKTIEEIDAVGRGMLNLMADTLAAPKLRRVRHKKRGTTYEVLGEAEMQITVDLQGNPFPIGNVRCRALIEGERLVVYRGENGKLWARFPDEFEDGRFEDVT